MSKTMSAEQLRKKFNILERKEQLKLTQILLEDLGHLWYGFQNMLTNLQKYRNLSEKQLDLIYNFNKNRTFSLVQKASDWSMYKSYERYQKSDKKENHFVVEEKLVIEQEKTEYTKQSDFYLKDAIDLIQIPEYWKMPFPTFNPIQSAIWPIRNENANFIISASTSAGKTIIAEIIMEAQIGTQVDCFLSPLKAVTKEKQDDWTNVKHRWSNKRLSIVTGDYVLSEDRIQELEYSDLVLMTTEMLLSRMRNMNSEKSQWLKRVHTLVIDESHLIGIDGRGDISEIGLVEFTKLNPDCRIVMLSATMPNVEEIRRWLTLLNGKPTRVLESTYRPTKLENKYVPIPWDGYKDFQERMVDKAQDIVDDHPESKHIIFCHTKKLMQNIQEAIPNSEMYSADVSKQKREQILQDFEHGNLKVIVSTSALAWGVNSPAEIVTICGVHRGMTLIQNVDIKQMQGRAGRIGKCTGHGISYTLLPTGKPENTFNQYVSYCKQTNDTKSQLNEKNLVFHLLGAIRNKIVKNKQEIEEWYGRTLAAFSGLKIDFDKVINELIKYQAIEETALGYSLKPVGKIASLLFYYPQDVFKLMMNLQELTKATLNDDAMLCFILGDLYSHTKIMNAAQKEEVNSCVEILSMDSQFSNILYCYYCILNNKYTRSFFNQTNALKADLERLETVAVFIDKLFCMNKYYLIKQMFARFKYGIPAHMLPLAEVKGIGEKALKKLAENNIDSVEKLKLIGPELQKKIFRSQKMYQKILSGIL